MNKCTRPPVGWYCSLEEGHSGPCPTWPALPQDIDLESLRAQLATARADVDRLTRERDEADEKLEAARYFGEDLWLAIFFGAQSNPNDPKETQAAVEYLNKERADRDRLRDENERLREAGRKALLPLATIKITDAANPYDILCDGLRKAIIEGHDALKAALSATSTESTAHNPLLCQKCGGPHGTEACSHIE